MVDLAGRWSGRRSLSHTTLDFHTSPRVSQGQRSPSAWFKER